MNIHGLIRAIERRKGIDERLTNGRVELARRELEGAANALYAANARAMLAANFNLEVESFDCGETHKQTIMDLHGALEQAYARGLQVEDELREILALKPSHRRSAIVALLEQINGWNTQGE